MALALEAKPETIQGLAAFRHNLVAKGYQEVVTYSFVDPALQKMVDPGLMPVALANPISADMAVMRTSLWSGLLQTAVYNLNRQQSRVRIFEAGQCFVPASDGQTGAVLGLAQNMALAGLICGARTSTGWTANKDKVDFYDIKGDLESLLGITGLAAEFTFDAGIHPALHPGQSAALSRNGLQVGWVGQLHPKIQADQGINTPVYLFQVDVEKIAKSKLPKHKEVSKFPEVSRDLAFFVDNVVTSSELISAAKAVAGEQLIHLKLFDVYQSKDIENKGKSIALGLTFQHSSRTLNDEEINQAIDRVVVELGNKYKAELRG
jgi:phenylalanyl-tRNA synthetase beta chain